MTCSARVFFFDMLTVIKTVNFYQFILYQPFYCLSMIKIKCICTKYLCEIALLKMVFSHFKDDQVNAEYMTRATLSRFCVNYVVYASLLNKTCMYAQGVDNDRVIYVFNLLLCGNKSNLHQQNLQC